MGQDGGVGSKGTEQRRSEDSHSQFAFSGAKIFKMSILRRP